MLSPRVYLSCCACACSKPSSVAMGSVAHLGMLLSAVSVSFEVMMLVLMTRKPLAPLVQLGESCRCERLMMSTAEDTSICGSNLTHPTCRQTSQNQTCLSTIVRSFLMV